MRSSLMPIRNLTLHAISDGSKPTNTESVARRGRGVTQIARLGRGRDAQTDRSTNRMIADLEQLAGGSDLGVFELPDEVHRTRRRPRGAAARAGGGQHQRCGDDHL